MENTLISEYQVLTTQELTDELNAFDASYKLWFECNQFTTNSRVLRTIKEHTTAIQTVLKTRVNK